MDKKEVQKKLSKACAQLMIKHPFFGSLVYQHDMEITDSVDTAAVNAGRVMLFNPEFVEKRDLQELIFLVAHEVMHVVFAHLARRGNRDPETWNIATDAVINELLVSEGVGTFIEGGIRMEGAETQTAENIYNMLAQQQSSSGSPSPSGSGGMGAGKRGNSATKDYKGSLGIKDLSLPATKGGHALTEQEVHAEVMDGKLKIGQAAAMARVQGKMSGNLGRFIESVLSSKLPWYELLEKFMVGKAEQGYNWSRPNRRMLNVAYMPSRAKYPSMGEVVVGIDVSGSISDVEIRQYLGHCKAIFELCRPSKVYVVYCDTEVKAVDEFERWDEVEPRKNLWYGGTHMPAIMEWIERNELTPDVCVTFTDGYTDYPRADQVPCELLWVLSTSYKPEEPRGEVIYALEEN